MRNNFNLIAGIYDTLSYAVFGNHINKAQKHFINQIKSNDHILIIGGGTGWLLEAIDALKLPLKITYIDLSTAMIKKAKNRKVAKRVQVDYIEGTVNNIPDQLYDVIITNFFLDVFTEKNLLKVMDVLKRRLDSQGLWICTDFETPNNFWQRGLLKCMFIFFRITTQLESNQLLVFSDYFKSLGFKQNESKLFYRRMIKTAVYKK